MTLLTADPTSSECGAPTLLIPGTHGKFSRLGLNAHCFRVPPNFALLTIYFARNIAMNWGSLSIYIPYSILILSPLYCHHIPWYCHCIPLFLDTATKTYKNRAGRRDPWHPITIVQLSGVCKQHVNMDVYGCFTTL